MDILNEALQNLRNYMRMASIMDVVDILIVAFLIYQLIGLLRRTTAVQVLKGLAIVLAGMGISSAFGLNVLSFILQNTMQVGLLAIVIVFQPELRRMLEKVGAARFFKLFGEESAPGSLENALLQTVSAAGELSKQRVGALVVFERTNRLDDVIRTGTSIDAETSGMLLKNIFFPNAALHDGAVVIRSGRVFAAGCMLPLTNNTNLSRDLGMRHRAGVGISEQSDAVSVIVSEETGAVSAAIGGILKLNLTPDTLLRVLQNELLPSAREQKSGSGFPGFLGRLKGRNHEDRKN